jgi:hypothetical protein
MRTRSKFERSGSEFEMKIPAEVEMKVEPELDPKENARHGGGRACSLRTTA